MKPQHLIQAFSRTNRLFDQRKRYGQVVTFQRPDKFKEAVDNALRLYSNGGENYVLAPEYDEEKAKFDQSVQKLKEIAPTPDSISHIESETTEKLRAIAAAFQGFDKLFASIQVYSDYEEGPVLNEAGLTRKIIEEYHGKYTNIIEELKSRGPIDGEEENEIDIYYELESVRTDEINYQYILSLIQSVIEGELSNKDKQSVDKYIEELRKSNSHLADIIGQLWTEVQFDPEKYRGQSVTHLLGEMIDETIEKRVDEFSKEWGVGRDELLYVAKNFRNSSSTQRGEDALNKSRDYDVYKEHAQDSAVSRIKYSSELKKEYTEMIREEIAPFLYRGLD